MPTVTLLLVCFRGFAFLAMFHNPVNFDARSFVEKEQKVHFTFRICNLIRALVRKSESTNMDNGNQYCRLNTTRNSKK